MNRLVVRLSLAFLIVAWVAIGALALIVQMATEDSFRAYVNQRNTPRFSDTVVSELIAYYTENETWSGADILLPGQRGGGSGGGQGSGSGAGHGNSNAGSTGNNGTGGATTDIADETGVIAASSDPDRIGQQMSDKTLETATPLEINGKTVGWLAQETPGTQALGSAETQFLDETTRWLVIAAIGATLIAVVVGSVLTWQITRPMRTLTHAAHTLAEGKLGQQVEVTGATELVELGTAFNRMSKDLAQGEALRQRMAANIAHELRTPVSVLRGHLEAMLDGVYPLDAEHLAVAYDRTLHMTRLVEDLRVLTRAEAGQLPLERAITSPEDLITHVSQSFTPLALDSSITLESKIAPKLPPVYVDIDRMHQVFGNLLTNALRHTPEGGSITLRAEQSNAMIRFTVENSGKRLSPQQAAHVFTPFWRAEEARERDKGGSGLGLAITQQFVMLHGGQIHVETGTNRTAFIFDVPIYRPSDEPN